LDCGLSQSSAEAGHRPA